MDLGIGRVQGNPLTDIVVPGNATKVHVTAKGLIDQILTLSASDIPALLSDHITDFATAADARIANAIGVSIQAYDADLTAIAALSPTNGDFIRRTGGVWVAASLVSADLTTALTTPPAFGGTTPAAITGTIITATTRLVSPILAPASDSTTAVQFTKADGSTVIAKIDTTNKRVIVPALTPSGSVGEGVNFYDGTNNLVNWQALDLGGTTYNFFATNRYYTGSAWSGTGFQSTRAGASVQLENDNFVLYTLAASSNTAVEAIRTTRTNTKLTAVDNLTSAVTNALTVSHGSSSGAPATGFGPGILAQAHSATVGNGYRDMGRLRWEWTTATDLSRASKMVLSTNLVATEVDVLTLSATASISSAIVKGSGGAQSIQIAAAVAASSSWQVVAANGEFYIYDASAGFGALEIIDGGKVRIGTNFASGDTAALHISSGALGTKGVVVRGVASQSAALQEWQTNAPATTASIPAAGGIRVHSDPGAGVASTETITNDVSGTPVNGVTPTKWLKIYDGTTARYLPVYT